MAKFRGWIQDIPKIEGRSRLILMLLFLSCLTGLVSITGCGQGNVSRNEIDYQAIDSLIEIHNVNDQTILVSFGYDAVTAIKTDNGIVLVDAGISTLLTGIYRKKIEEIFRQKDFVYVVNTHCHNDHIRGNSLFPSAQIVAHKNCVNDFPATNENPDTRLSRISGIVTEYDQQLQVSAPGSPEWVDNYTQKMRYQGAYSDIKAGIPFRLPDITFEDSLTLDCGDTTLEMVYFGKLHSESDIVIFIPELRLLFTGDLFSKYGRPSLSNQDVIDTERWIQSTGWIKKRIESVDSVIDGHGHILTTGDVSMFIENLASKYQAIETN